MLTPHRSLMTGSERVALLLLLAVCLAHAVEITTFPRDAEYPAFFEVHLGEEYVSTTTAADFQVPALRGDMKKQASIQDLLKLLRNANDGGWAQGSQLPGSLPPTRPRQTPVPLNPIGPRRENSGRDSVSAEVEKMLQPLPDLSSTTTSGNMLSEFTLRGTSSHYDLPESAPDKYTKVIIYSNAVTGRFKMESTWTHNEETFYEIVVPGKVFSGKIVGGKYMAESCDLLTQSENLMEGMNDFKPEELTSWKQMAANAHCPGCNQVLSVVFTGRKYILLAKSGQPRLGFSRDSFLNIESFTPENTYTVPDQVNAKCKVPDTVDEEPEVKKPNAPHVFVEEEAVATDHDTAADPSAEAILGVKAKNGVYTVINDKWYNRKHTFKFKKVRGRWLWQPNDKDGNCWMSVATYIPLCGDWTGDDPRDAFKEAMSRLWTLEKGTKEGQRPLDDSEIKYLLGSKYKGSSNKWRVKVSWAEDLYFRLKQVNGAQKFEWSPNNKVWYGVHTTKDTRNWLVRERLTSVNKHLIRSLDYYETASQKQSAQNDAGGGLGANECHPTWKGDGFCDEACNNAGNGYDGGDCCRGTCSDHRYVCGANGYHCKAKDLRTKPCLFIHGAGVPGQMPPGVSAENVPATSMQLSSLGSHTYWGNMAKEMQGVCTSFSFLHANTDEHGWTNKVLQDGFYAKAHEVYKKGGVVFAHSLGNLVLAGACLDQSKCGVKWYGLGGPIRGSSAADAAKKLSKIAPSMFTGSTTSLHTTHRGLRRGATQREALGRVVYDHQLYKGFACGTTGSGSGGKAGVLLSLANGIAFPGRKADGLVAFDECQYFGWQDGTKWKVWYLKDKKPSTKHTSVQFRTLGNHLDLTGDRGNYDGILDWYRNMAKRG